MDKKNIIKMNLMMFVVNYRTVLILILLVLAISLSTPYFLNQTNLLNVLRQISVTAILGAGFTLVVASGNLDFSVGAVVSLVGIVVAMLSKLPGMPLIAVVIIGILIGAIIGFINGIVSVSMKVIMLLTTFALAQVYLGLTYFISNWTPILGIPEGLQNIGQGYWGPIPIPVYIMFIVTIICGIILYRTKLGRYALAIGGNAEAAEVSGININSTKILLLVIMGICAAIGAIILTGRAASGQPSAGVGMEMDALTAVVIGGTSIYGGRAKIHGTLLGALIVGIINNGLNLIGADSTLQLVGKGLLILIALSLDVQSELFVRKMLTKLKT